VNVGDDANLDIQRQSGVEQNDNDEDNFDFTLEF